MTRCLSSCSWCEYARTNEIPEGRFPTAYKSKTSARKQKARVDCKQHAGATPSLGSTTIDILSCGDRRVICFHLWDVASAIHVIVRASSHITDAKTSMNVPCTIFTLLLASSLCATSTRSHFSSRALLRQRRVPRMRRL